MTLLEAVYYTVNNWSKLDPSFRHEWRLSKHRFLQDKYLSEKKQSEMVVKSGLFVKTPATYKKIK